MVTKKNGYILAIQKQPLRVDITTTHGTLIMNLNLNGEIYRSTFSSNQEIKKSVVLNGKLSEKCL